MLAIVALAAALFAGLSFFLFVRVRGLETQLVEAQEQGGRKEARLLGRERSVLAAMFEGELAENKNRIEAFLAIYGDLLSELKNPAVTPKYQQGGDIIQKHPALTRLVFEGNSGRLSLFDLKLSGQISKVYAAFPPEQEYLTLQPTDSLLSVIGVVEKALREAEALLPAVEATRAALESVVNAVRAG